MGKFINFNKPFNVLTRIDYTEETLNVPIKLWLSKVEDSTLQQMYNVARLPFIYKHLAGMPDSHLGYGMPIGGVMATVGYVVPNAVGVDIGCGMIVIRTSLRQITKNILNKIKQSIKKLIPVSFKHNKKPQEGMPTNVPEGGIVEREYDSATRQLGTLGGGNHFIEIQMGDDGYIYIMIHSGSRNIGNKVAQHYNNLAVELNEKWFSQVPKKWELAFLPIFDKLGQDYILEMTYCTRFAAANRMLMLNRVEEAFKEEIPDVDFYASSLVDVAHNYARMENHYGKNVMVHRKGATAAYKDQMGIIPGSQGTSSFIVRGKGNRESFMSCSHGAGRTLGRKQAKKDLVLEDEIKKLDDQGILHDIKTTNDLEEASSAYKDINDVMAHQTNLVEIVRELKPLAVVKG